MMSSKQLRNYVIIPTLNKLDMNSDSAITLLLGVAAQESMMGTYIAQIGNGIARGIFQMEEATYVDIWENYLDYNPSLVAMISETFNCDVTTFERLTYDMELATVFARLHFRRRPEALPSITANVKEFGEYWKQHYNTIKGAGTVDQYINSFNKYVLDNNLPL